MHHIKTVSMYFTYLNTLQNTYFINIALTSKQQSKTYFQSIKLKHQRSINDI